MDYMVQKKEKKKATERKLSLPTRKKVLSQQGSLTTP